MHSATTRTFTLIALLLASGAACAQAPVSLCQGAEQVVFSCQASQGRVISVCAALAVQGSSQLAYRFGTGKKLELQLLADPAATPTAVEGNQSQGARGYDHFIRFKTMDYAYTVRDFWGGCPSPGQGRCPPEASFSGVLVSQAGRAIGKTRCTGSITSMAPDALVRLRVPASETWPQ